MILLDQLSLIIALTCIASAVAVFVRAMIWHPSPGSSRCRRCTYDMTGTLGLVCSECGLAHTSQRALLAPRLRRRLLIWPVVFCLLGYAAWVTPEVRSHGPWSALPRPLAILLLPVTQSRFEGLGACISRHLLPQAWRPRSMTWIEKWALGHLLLHTISNHRTEEAQSLAAHLLVLYRPDLLDQVPPACVAPLVLARVAHRYGACIEYHDTCTYEVTQPNGSGPSSHLVGTTSFRRDPLSLQAEGKDSANLHRPPTVSIDYSQGTGRMTIGLIGPDSTPQTLSDLLFGFSGTLIGSRPWVMQLLVRDHALGPALTEMTGVSIIEEFQDDSGHFIRMQGGSVGNVALDIVIESRSFAIVRVTETKSLLGVPTRIVIHYKPTMPR